MQPPNEPERGETSMSSTDKPKLCRECRNIRPYGNCVTTPREIRYRFAKCAAAPCDPVSGDVSANCKIERVDRNGCGPEGRYWEARG
jgi:hypothetical protein